MTTVVLSYRRDDSAAICGRIYDRLREHFGHDSVFMDIDAIPLGADFREHIRKTISRADAFLAIAGPRWLGKKKTHTRIADPSDWVRIELEVAFESKIPVLPVLVDGAAMPKAQQLPPSIREFAYLQAARVDSGLDFHPHVDRLIKSIDHNIAKQRQLFEAEKASAIVAGPDRAASAEAHHAISFAAAEANPIRSQTAVARWTTASRRWFYNRRAAYWLTAFAALVCAYFATPYVEDYLNVVSARDFLYQQISQLEPRAIEPRYTKVVWIGDDEYWRPPLNGRSPINRKYLAEIVRALDDAGAAVIALDFSVRLLDPNATGDIGRFDEIPQPYRQETDELVRAIVNAAAKGRKIVLSKTIWYGNGGGYALLPDIYQPYGLCTGFDKQGHWLNPGIPGIQPAPSPQKIDWRSNISCGYIALPYDMRLLPPALKVLHHGQLDSFSLAIARAYDPERVAELPDKIYYGGYIPETALARAHATLSAAEILRRPLSPETESRLEHRAVIVGGHWSQSHMGHADFIDEWPTPLGLISGAVIHQNFVEAVLDGRNFEVIPKWILAVATIVFGILAVLLFAKAPSILSKFLVLVVLFVILSIIQWFMMMVFGTFFDAFVILVVLWVQSTLSRRWLA